MSESITLTVNGVSRTVHCTGKESLLEILRDHLELTGAKEGCGYGACGTCTVIVNGDAILACTLRGKKKLDGISVTTIEAVADPGGELHPIQEAFIEAGAVQCGFCTPGFVMRLLALYTKDIDASEEMLKEALSKHLCRCTGYETIWEAALLARKKMKERGLPETK